MRTITTHSTRTLQRRILLKIKPYACTPSQSLLCYNPTPTATSRFPKKCPSSALLGATKGLCETDLGSDRCCFHVWRLFRSLKSTGAERGRLCAARPAQHSQAAIRYRDGWRRISWENPIMTPGLLNTREERKGGRFGGKGELFLSPKETDSGIVQSKMVSI
ncbi:uncharacterized protein LOC130556160 isoform X2 [Triplophysa rosa]|uniref:uncharacterized protein LOC130556160 isoform X2 n=1 Tax=Triplophysa rosa TaxID=992332 RepID=UPI002545FC23|nr:uncharacterized protein LOC130556160 isoform X2 [Triplophysa rosa]